MGYHFLFYRFSRYVRRWGNIMFISAFWRSKLLRQATDSLGIHRGVVKSCLDWCLGTVLVTTESKKYHRQVHCFSKLHYSFAISSHDALLQLNAVTITGKLVSVLRFPHYRYRTVLPSVGGIPVVRQLYFRLTLIVKRCYPPLSLRNSLLLSCVAT